MLITFLAVYGVVVKSVYYQIDENLSQEADEIFKDINIKSDSFEFNNSTEWVEREHGTLEANPVYVQIIDDKGKTIVKTPSLLRQSLFFDPKESEKIFYNTDLPEFKIRQYQSPIKNSSGKTLGYVIIAVPLEEYEFVLSNLKLILLISFPIVLILLFVSAKYITGKSINPINNVINTAEKITKDNLKDRIAPPPHKDEIYQLISTINKLLDRIEDSVLREKQFISDASHELRTPLSVVKGTLEVLNRKPRDAKEYPEKINYCIDELDRMSELIERLLLLARYERDDVKPLWETFNVFEITEKVIDRYKDSIRNKNLKIDIISDDDFFISADKKMTEIIIDNIFSNAIKYTHDKGKITIETISRDDSILYIIKDTGIGIDDKNSERIFDRFFRIDESRNSEVKGYGLGLSLVKRFTDMQNIRIHVDSKVNEGTSFSLYFRKVTSENF